MLTVIFKGVPFQQGALDAARGGHLSFVSLIFVIFNLRHLMTRCPAFPINSYI